MILHREVRQYSAVLIQRLLLCLPITCASAGEIQQQFSDPPDSARVHVWWHWMNGNVSKEGITKDLEYMRAVGIGGLQHFDLDQYIPAGPIKHNSTQWHELMRHAISEANRLGLEFGFNQCSGWSNSGGVWITPEHSMKTVVWSETLVSGDSNQRIQLLQPEAKHNFYRDIAVLAFPTPQNEQAGGDGFRIDNWKRKSVAFIHVNDHAYRLPRDTRLVMDQDIIKSADILELTKSMQPDGSLTWTPPPGKWTILRFGYTTTGMANHPASYGAEGLECDKMSRAALDVHWEALVERVIADAGPHVGKTLTTVLVDSYEVAQQNWTDRFAEEFRQRRGYDLTNWLPCMTGRVVESLELSERFLWDLRRTIADLITENYFEYFAERCRAANLKFSIEPYGSGYFDEFDGAMAADVPMGEFWIDPVGWARLYWWINKLVASAAHLGGKLIATAEAFTASSNYDRWSTSPAQLKQLGDLVFTMGINRLVIHGAVHQPWANHVVPGMTMGPWGMHLSRNNTWTPHARAWFDYMARCQYILQQGQFVADLLYIYNEDAPNTNEARERMQPTPPVGYDYDVSNYKLLSVLRVQDGQIVAPSGLKYRILVVPAAKFSDRRDRKTHPNNLPYMRPETLEQLARLAKAGALILCEKPLGSPSLTDYPQCDEQVRKLADELWGSGRIKQPDQLGEMIRQIDLQPDFEANSGELAYIHRKIDGGDYYFVSNQDQEAFKGDARFRVSGKRPELWDPMTGSITPAANWKQLGDGRSEVNLGLPRGASVFVVFREATTQTGAEAPQQIFNELLSINGAWTVRFGKYGPTEPVIFEQLTAWDKHPLESIRYYAGVATYQQTFNVPSDVVTAGGRIVLDLGEVYVLAKVTLNGKPLGTLWHPPFHADMSDVIRPGENKLEVMVVNQWANRLIGEARHPTDAPLNTERPYGRWRWEGSYQSLPDWVSQGEPPTGQRRTFAAFELWKADDELLPSGLLGPVRILSLASPGSN